jgi:hypothetical protein
MIIPKEFDQIRPWEPEDLPEVYDRLLANEQFLHVIAYLYPKVPLEFIADKLRKCKTNLNFQLEFVYPFLKDLMSKASLGLESNFEALDNTRNYTFISNHRDIVLDSALLDVSMVDAGFKTTCEIAIGDNLLSLPWVKDLVRVNKAFIVERSLSMRQMLLSSKRLGEYMHFAIQQKKENIWIAQREGRAKDSNGRTQESILKMMAMGGEGSVIDRLVALHLVPTSISYEYDPCDFLKAKEFQLKRDVEGWKKSPMDDVISMQTGIFGYKGHVYYHTGACLDEWLRSLPADIAKTDLYAAITDHIDHDIYMNYRLYPGNYVALDELNGTNDFASYYTSDEKAVFDKYLDKQLEKIDLENKDIPFLRNCMLTMYANPVINQQKVK